MVFEGWQLWVGFNVFVVAMLAVDLLVFHKKHHAIKMKEAAAWTVFWIVLAMAFNGIIYFWRGHDTALEFLTGYVIEKSLSVDNLFVFLLIFSYFSIPSKYQHEVLFWGIVGALVMRMGFIFAGIALIERFHWISNIFGGILVASGIKIGFEKKKEIHPEKNPVLRLFKRIMPTTNNFHGGKFFIKKGLKYFATPLFVTLLVIETTDVVFAVDSVPAVLAITLDPFIVYTSNVFAILGLRALFFVLAGVMKMFKHLHYGLAAILVFVGIKMLVSQFYKIPVAIALGVVGGILMISIAASILAERRNKPLTKSAAGRKGFKD